MKRLVRVSVQAVIDVEDVSEVEEAIDDIVQFADWDVDSYAYTDCGEVEENV